MSSSTTTRAARSPSASAPWHALSQEKGWAGCLLLRRDATGCSREWACCDSHAKATKLAAALNREERLRQQAEVWRHECALRRDALCDLVEDLHLPRFRRPPAVRECVWDQVERLLEEGGRR